MYYISKRFEISGAHSLQLDYESKCKRLHGHNWIVTVYCKSKELDNNGMVYDFAHIKGIVNDELDHRYLNKETLLLTFNFSKGEKTKAKMQNL